MRKIGPKDRSKVGDVRERIKDAVTSGHYFVSNHAYSRSQDRRIPIPHVEYVLLNGFHEKRKDSFQEEFSSWNYSIRGKTPDRVDARIVVALNDDGVLVVTVINFDL